MPHDGRSTRPPRLNATGMLCTLSAYRVRRDDHHDRRSAGEAGEAGEAQQTLSGNARSISDGNILYVWYRQNFAYIGRRRIYRRWLRRPRLPQPARIRRECVYLLNINVLSRFKPYAGVGTYVLSGLTYTGGVEYRIDFAMENTPSLTISSLFSSGGHRGTSNRHEWALGVVDGSTSYDPISTT